MRTKITAITLLMASLNLINAQETQMESQEDAVKKVVETFFDGFHKQDSVLIKSTVNEGVIFQTTGRSSKDGKTVFKTDDFHKFLKNIVSIPDSVAYQEKLTSFNIQIDATMANAWVGYEFWLNDKFSHCGINCFQMIDFDGKWKIIYLIDTRKRKGCDAYIEEN